MTQSFRRLRERRAQDGLEAGFTLIELLIVIVILGILAAIVVFALGGITGKSTVAACQSDAKTVGTAVGALEAQNPVAVTSDLKAWQSDLLATTATTDNGQTISGGPYLQSWPTGSTSYTVAVYGANTWSGTYYSSGTTSNTPNYGDVMVAKGNNISPDTSGVSWYNATVDPTGACQSAING